jgi:hypothetical protein
VFTDNIKVTHINSSEVYANFDLAVPVIYKEIIALNQGHNVNILKSLTAIVTVYDLNKHKTFKIDELKSRAHDYGRAVNEYLDVFSFKGGFDDWVDFLSFLYLKTKKDQNALGKSLQQEQAQEQEQEVEGLIIESATREVVREISHDEKDLILEIAREHIKKNTRLKGRYFQLVIEKIIENKKKIAAKIKDKIKKKQKKENLLLKTLRFLGWNLIEIQLAKYRITNVTQKAIDTNLMSLKRRTFAKAGLEFNLNTRKTKIIKDIVSKKGENAQYLYSAFHSHNPEEKLKLPNSIANNIELKREATRLGSTGMSKYAAAHEAQHNIGNSYSNQVSGSKSTAKGGGISK